MKCDIDLNCIDYITIDTFNIYKNFSLKTLLDIDLITDIDIVILDKYNDATINKNNIIINFVNKIYEKIIIMIKKLTTINIKNYKKLNNKFEKNNAN